MTYKDTKNKIQHFNTAAVELKKITEHESKQELKYSESIQLEMMNLLVKLQNIEHEIDQYAPNMHQKEFLQKQHLH